MELNSIIFSRIAWAGRLVQPPGGVYMRHAVDAMREFGKFIEYPEKLEDFDLNRGVTFKHGIFSSENIQPDKIVIGEITIYINGLIVISQSPTEEMDVFIKELRKYMVQRLGVELELNSERGKNYTSHLEVVIEKAPPLTEVEQRIGERINDCYSSYGFDTAPFEKSGFSFSLDASHIPNFPVPRFFIERRAGMPYSSNTYFSDASLATSDHLEVLEEFEKAILRQ